MKTAREVMDIPDINLFDAMQKRKTTTSFTQQAVEFEKIAQIIQAGMLAPSAGNLQNWQFIVVTEKGLLRELFHHTLEQEVFMTAPIGVIVCADVDLAEKFYGLRGKRLYLIQDCAACIENMLLTAEAFDLGACWVGAFDEEKVASMFGIPKNVRAQAIILFGYPESEPERKEKKRIDYLVYFNRYGQRIEKPHLVLRDYSSEWKLRSHDIKEKLSTAKPLVKEETKQKIVETTKNTFAQTQEKLKNALSSLKDEEKMKRRRQ